MSENCDGRERKLKRRRRLMKAGAGGRGVPEGRWAQAVRAWGRPEGRGAFLGPAPLRLLRARSSFQLRKDRGCHPHPSAGTGGLPAWAPGSPNTPGSKFNPSFPGWELLGMLGCPWKDGGVGEVGNPKEVRQQRQRLRQPGLGRQLLPGEGLPAVRGPFALMAGVFWQELPVSNSFPLRHEKRT